MKRIKCFTSLVVALLLFSTCEEHFASAQGTVVNSLFDYIMNMNNSPTATSSPTSSLSSAASSPTSSSSSSTSGSGSPTPTDTGSSSGSSGTGALFDLYSQMMQSPAQPTPAPAPPQPSPTQAPYAAAPPTTLPPIPMSFFQNSGTPAPPTPAPPSLSEPNSFYNQLMQNMNQIPPQQQLQQQVQPTQPPPPMNPPYLDPFYPTAPPPPTPKPAPKIMPFVPPEWNLTTPLQSAWAANAKWSHGGNSYHGGPTGWAHPRPMYQQPAQQQQRQQQQQQHPHPMGGMTMMPKIRDMINKQAVQFGDMAYYQQHGCLDPTPTVPGPGGVRPTQTLVYGCQSPVSRMVCMRAGKTATGKTSTMSMMMSMMNPAMTTMMEKCLSPRTMNQMMFQGFSGGTGGGMNPMMMMAMSGGGGGGGGMAGMMPMLMAMMSQQQQQQRRWQSQAPSPPSLSRPVGSTLGPSPAKTPYSDPAGANTLISQAARIPQGAAQPMPQQSSGGGGSLMSAFSSMLGMGGGSNAQTPASSTLPAGAALPGSASSASSYGGAGSAANAQPDCSQLMPLMMSKMMAAGEGLNSPEAMEAIGEMRKQYLPYSCQEMRLKYTGLPLRLCCPGRVDPPTVFDLFKAKNAGGA